MPSASARALSSTERFRARARRGVQQVSGHYRRMFQLRSVLGDAFSKYSGKLHYVDHHLAHAASAFFASPFADAAIVTMDGVGEWATASIGVGEGHRIELLKEMRFPASLGLLYSAFTQFTGFKVNSGEYKMMGLAPYGSPIYAQAILDHLVDLKDDGSLELNLDYFAFLRG